MNIVLQLSELRLSKALPPPPWKGGLLPNVVYIGVCRWTGYRFGLCPKHGKLFYAHLPQPGMVSTIDIPFRFSVLKRARV